MFSLLQTGGWVMGVILGCGALAVFVFLERFLHIHRARIKTDDFLKGICNILRRGNIEEALTICDETPGPAAHLVQTAIRLRAEPDPAAMGRAIDTAALAELGRLERRLGILATLAQVAPFLGILGTVLGMIQAFLAIQRKAPLIQISDLSGGLWQALLTTAAGLVLALFCTVAYNLLATKIQAVSLDMETASNEILDFFAGARPETDGRGARS